MLADYSGNYHGYQHDPHEANNSGQQQRIVILWDLLKTRLRKSEVEEMARMIGTELIDNLESFRTELENLIQINKDLKEERNQRTGGDTVADSKSLMSESQQNDNLHQKATASGLKEEALIPMGSSKDKKIYESLRPQSKLGRPQSAMQKDGKRLSEKENSPTHTAMRSSFYSMSMMGDLNIETEDEKEIARFQQEQASRGAVVNQVNFKNILELSQTEQELLAEIKKFMNVQVDELQTEIDSMQKLMLEQAAAVASEAQSDQEEEEVVTQKDVKQYAEKLKEEFLNSDHRVKIATLPNPASSQTKRMNVTGNSFTSYLNKHKPLPLVAGGSFKPAAIGLGGMKTPIKLKTQVSLEQPPQQRTSIGKANLPGVGPLKAQLSARESQLSARGSESGRGPDSARGGQLSARGVAFAQNAVAVYKEIREQNPKKIESTPTKRKSLNESQAQNESGQKRSNSIVKKIKLKRKESRDRLTTGRSAVKSRQQTEGSPKQEKKISPGGTVTIIPVSQIKMNKPDLFTGKWQESGTTVLGSSNTKKLKLTKKKTEPLNSNLPIEEPRIIDTTKSTKPPETENLYGLDISILKSLNMDHLLEEKKAQQEQNTSKENWYLQNKDMEELRKEHSMQPVTKGGANKLRMMCSFYKNEDELKEEDSN